MIFAQDSQSLTDTALNYAVVMALLAGFGWMGRWVLGQFGRMLELQSSTLTEAVSEIKLTREQRDSDFRRQERISKAFETAVDREEKVTKMFLEATENCAQTRLAYERHIKAVLARKDQGGVGAD